MERTFAAAVTGLAMMIFLGGCAGGGVEGGVHRAAYGDAEVVYEIHGADPEAGMERTALVFVHGWACDRTYWADQIDGMGADRVRLALDLPGYGESTDGGAEHTMDLYAGAVAAAMDHAGIGEAVLIGHSMGTPVIRQFYRMHPERTAGLIAVDGALRPFAPPEQMEQMTAPLFTDQWKEWAVQMFDGMAGSMADDTDREHVRTVMMSTSKEAMRGGFSAMNDESIWGTDRIGVPILLTLAPAPFWTEEYKGYVRELAPEADFVTFEGASHFLMMDQPRKFNQVASEWLEHRGL